MINDDVVMRLLCGGFRRVEKAEKPERGNFSG
jgi:hypothetical protein